jgi:sortase A
MSVPYRYLKAAPLGYQLAKQKKWLFFWRSLSVLVLITGLVLLANAALPIAFYELTNNQFKAHFVSPLATSKSVLGETISPDYANPKNWFPVAPILPPQPSRITDYSLSIPKLGIEDARVQIGGEDMMENLVQYPGTALPGQYGNSVIFGHSVLPQFFNPKNYKTIFSTLPTLKEGDEILIDFDGIRYRYLVRKMVEAKPEDVTILEQNYDSQWLSLITCVPPGTYLRRLIVRAQLVTQ